MGKTWTIMVYQDEEGSDGVVATTLHHSRVDCNCQTRRKVIIMKMQTEII